jgi:hypothetical protein
MVYLNDVPDADGGATRFYGRGEDSSDWQVCEQVQPRAGMAVVFPHSLSHDGELCNARKYILRSDVLFEMDVAKMNGVVSTTTTSSFGLIYTWMKFLYDWYNNKNREA